MKWTIVLVAAACSLARVDLNASAMRYDGTTRAFIDFAAEQDQTWPAPAEIGLFEAPDGVTLRYARWMPPGAARPSTGTSAP